MFPLRDSIDHHEPSIVTKLLIGANILVFLWQFGGGIVGLEGSVLLYGFIPGLFFSDPAQEWYRLFTSMFLHGSLVHVGSNMWFLWVFGPTIEARIGSLKFLLLYLATGAGATLAHGLTDVDALIPMVGASGAISGVLGAYIVLYSRASVLTMVWFVLPFFFWVPAGLYLGYWILIQVLQGFAGTPGTAWWAHVGGFVLGFILIRFLDEPRPYRTEPYWGADTGLR